MANMELVITDCDFPLLAGLCGLEKQVEHVCKFLPGTLAAGMTPWGVAEKGGFFETPRCFVRARKYVPFEPRSSDYLQVIGSGENKQVSMKISGYPVTLQTRQPEQIMKRDKPCNIVFGPHSKATLLQLAFINHIYPAKGGGVIINGKDNPHYYSQRHLKRLFQRACKKRALCHAICFLVLIRSCQDWQEFDDRVFVESLSSLISI